MFSYFLLVVLVLLSSSSASGGGASPTATGTRTVSFNYSLPVDCSAANTLPGLSWCKYNNPYVLSDFLSRNSTDFTIAKQTLEPNNNHASFNVSWVCAAPRSSSTSTSTSPHAKVCRAIQQIGTGSVGPLLQQNAMKRYVIFTDVSGQMLFVDFNQNMMANTMQVDVENIHFFDTSEVRVEDPEDGPNQILVLLAGNTSYASLFAILPNGTVTPSCFLFNNYNLDDPYQLSQLQFFPKFSRQQNQLVSLAWVLELKVPGNVSLPPGGPLPAGNYSYYAYNINTAPVRENEIITYLLQCWPGVPDNIQRQINIYGLNPVTWSIFQNVASNLTFVIGFSKRAINFYFMNWTEGDPYEYPSEHTPGINATEYISTVFSFPEECGYHQAYNSTTSGWEWVNRSATTVFCAKDNSTWITSVQAFSPDQFKQIGGFVKDIWLAIGLQNRTHSFLKLFDLRELVFDKTWEPLSLLNPLGLPASFGTPEYPCDFDTQALDPWGECTNRFVLEQVFESDENELEEEENVISSILLRGIQDGMNTNITITWNTSNGGGGNGDHNHSTVLLGSDDVGNFPSNSSSVPSWWNNYTQENLTDGAIQFPIIREEHTTMFVARGRKVAVLTIYKDPYVNDTNLHEAPPVLMDVSNEIEFLGKVQHMWVSPNAQHLFVAVTRNEWELESQQRYKEICETLTVDPDNVFLKEGFTKSCAQWPPQDININSFTQYVSYCTFNTYCPTLERVVAQMVESSYYADRPAVKKLCPRGYFCPPTGEKMECPFGFYCPEEGMVAPLRCPVSEFLNETCAQNGLTQPLPCPPGSICFVPHIPGIPAPPGNMTKAPYSSPSPSANGSSKGLFENEPSSSSTTAAHLRRRNARKAQGYAYGELLEDETAALPPNPLFPFLPCPSGWWCTLGAQQPYTGAPDGITNNTFSCPPNTFCPAPNVTEPSICNCEHGKVGDVECNGRIMWCPSGTSDIQWCPAGQYCTQPNKSETCVPSQYCPEGTFAPQLCPGGKYCPNASVALTCPEGHYCPRGSTIPVKCNFLTLCPNGSESQSRSFLAPVVLVVVIIGVLVGFFVFTWFKTRESKWVETVKPFITPASPRGGPGGGGSFLGDTRSVEMPTETQSLLSHNMSEAAERAAVAGSLTLPTSRFKTPTIEFKNMGLTLQVGEAKGKRVLDDVSGVIPPGSFVAVMGPSGSGKSTFMTTLAGKAFYGTRSGEVLVNGDPVDLTAFSKVIGFVKQDDIMLREMTVQETLLFNSRMRYDPQSGESPEAICNAMLTALDLNHVRGTPIGDEKKRGISGGQRKRVNIGMEMCALPCILFLDEPTSGLDSSSSMTVCAALRELASAGNVTVIAVIHQPRYEIFQMFHKVLLLAKGGKLVYYGSPTEALPYFETHLGMQCPQHVNPPDFFMDVISDDENARMPIDAMVDKWRQYVAGDSKKIQQTSHTAGPLTIPLYDIGGNAMATEAAGKEMASFFQQLVLFTGRSFVQLSRDLVWFFTDLVLVLVAGFFLGLVFSRSEYRPPLPQQIVNKSINAFDGNAPPDLVAYFNRPIDDPIVSEASLTCMAIGMTGVTAALRVFGNEQIVYWREASAGMSTSAYFFAKNISHIFFIVLSPLLYLAPFLTFVSARASIVNYYYVCLACQFTTTGLGYLISAIAPSGLSQLAGVVTVLVFSMFGGARPTLVEIQEMFYLLRIMPYISYIRWAQEALYITEIREWAHVEGVDINPSLNLFDYHVDDYSLCVGLTFAFGVGFRLLALLAMSLMNRDQKH